MARPPRIARWVETGDDLGGGSERPDADRVGLRRRRSQRRRDQGQRGGGEECESADHATIVVRRAVTPQDAAPALGRTWQRAATVDGQRVRNWRHRCAATTLTEAILAD